MSSQGSVPSHLYSRSGYPYPSHDVQVGDIILSRKSCILTVLFQILSSLSERRKTRKRELYLRPTEHDSSEDDPYI